jgi:hypothetical protein
VIGGEMNTATRLREEAYECEKVARLESERARIDRMIAKEEERRQQIAKRLDIELKRLESLRKFR